MFDDADADADADAIVDEVLDELGIEMSGQVRFRVDIGHTASSYLLAFAMYKHFILKVIRITVRSFNADLSKI